MPPYSGELLIPPWERGGLARKVPTILWSAPEPGWLSQGDSVPLVVCQGTLHKKGNSGAGASAKNKGASAWGRVLGRI